MFLVDAFRHNPSEPKRERAFRSLIEARYRLVERHAGLGEILTRLTIHEPSEACNVIACKLRGRCETDTICTDNAILWYNTDFVLSLCENEALFVLAYMGVLIRDGANEWRDVNAQRLILPVSDFSIACVAYARTTHLGLGQPLGTAVEHRLITHETSFDDAYQIALELMKNKSDPTLNELILKIVAEVDDASSF